MSKARRTSALSFVAAVVAGLTGFAAFNVIDGIFGVVNAVLGLVVCVAVTVFVARRSPPEKDASDA